LLQFHYTGTTKLQLFVLLTLAYIVDSILRYNYIMKRHAHWYHHLYLALFILSTSAIIVLASFSGEVSSNQSSTLLNILIQVIDFLGINLTTIQLDELHIFVRKAIGHFALFLINGVFTYLSAYYWLYFSHKTKLFYVFGFGLLLAGLSEFIQIYAPDRGPTFADAFIDFSGFSFGVIITVLILIVIRNRSIAAQKHN